MPEVFSSTSVLGNMSIDHHINWNLSSHLTNQLQVCVLAWTRIHVKSFDCWWL